MSELNMAEPVLAIQRWRSNAHLIADCARLGYLRVEWTTLDPTYGEGTFWQEWQPEFLLRTDLDPDKSPDAPDGVDFTDMPWDDRTFDCVVLDPPYKLQGTPASAAMDGRYGTGATASRKDRMDLIRAGIAECARVLGQGYLLLKCQDQVNGGKVRWQTIEFAHYAELCGLGLVDRLDLLSYRPQPAGRRQVHARRNASTLLVFKRGW